MHAIAAQTILGEEPKFPVSPSSLHKSRLAALSSSQLLTHILPVFLILGSASFVVKRGTMSPGASDQ